MTKLNGVQSFTFLEKQYGPSSTLDAEDRFNDLRKFLVISYGLLKAYRAKDWSIGPLGLNHVIYAGARATRLFELRLRWGGYTPG